MVNRPQRIRFTTWVFPLRCGFVCMFTTRTLLEGKWPLLVLAALAGASLWWRCPTAAVISLALLAFTVSFFRDPTRPVPADPQVIVAPADGKVVEIANRHEAEFLQTDATMVAIFLSVFDVHVQRAPVAGEIKLVRYRRGQFLDARNPHCSTVNENRVIGLQSADGFRVTVRQIAGVIARRIVGWAGEGAPVAKGERLGMIRFGSRVELFLPPSAVVTVKVGDRVKGGETIIARKR